jgi:hypothetical protein
MPRRLPLGAVFVACVVARVGEDEAAQLLRASLAPETVPPARRPARGAHAARPARRSRRARRGACAPRRRR